MILDQKLVRKALNEAIDLSIKRVEGKTEKVRKFDETIDLIINIRDVDIKNPNNRIDQELLLPHPITGNKPKDSVVFIVKDEMELKLRQLGYNIINPKQLDELQRQSMKDKKSIAKKYAYFVTRADLMRDVAKVLARFLGQQNKMPKPAPKGFGVIRPDENIDAYLPQLDRIIKLDMKKQLLLQLKVAKKSQNVTEIFENIDSVLSFVEHALPNGNNNIKSIFIKTTMGKPVKVEEPLRKGR